MKDYLAKHAGIVIPTRRSTMRKAFPKVEKMMKFLYKPIDFAFKLYPMTLRFIQSISPEANYIIGPYCHAVMGTLFHCLPDSVHSACGDSVIAVGQWIRRGWDAGYHYIASIDRTNWDGMTTSWLIQQSFRIYQTILPMTKDEKFIFDSQLKTRGFTKDGSFYSTIGKVHSGDPNTSLGNTLMAMISATYHCRLLHLTFRVIALGDDMLIMTKQPFPMDLFIEMQKRDFGIITKCKISTNPVDCEFLSSHPLPAYYAGKEVWAMTPLIGRCLPKLYYWQQPIDKIPVDDWIRGVNNTMYATAGHNPFIRRFLDTTKMLIPDGPCYYDKFSLAKVKYKLHGCVGLQMHPDADSWLAKRYGLWYHIHSAQVYTQLLRVTRLPTLLPFCNFSCFTERDL